MSGESSNVFPLPISNRIYKTVFYTILFILVVFLLLRSRSFNETDRMFPYLIGIPVTGVLIIHIFLLLFPSLEERLVPQEEGGVTDEVDDMLEKVAEVDTGRPLHERQKYEFIMIGWVVLLGLSIYLFGYAILPVYIYIFWTYLLNNARLSLILTIIFTVVAYLLFIYFLEMTPWTGIFSIPILGV